MQQTEINCTPIALRSVSPNNKNSSEPGIRRDRYFQVRRLGHIQNLSKLILYAARNKNIESSPLITPGKKVRTDFLNGESGRLHPLCHQTRVSIETKI